jgi:hypothetical protein
MAQNKKLILREERNFLESSTVLSFLGSTRKAKFKFTMTEVEKGKRFARSMSVWRIHHS